MSRLYADCQNLAGWIKQKNPNQQTIDSLVISINNSVEKDSVDTIKIALERMPQLAPYIDSAGNKEK